MDTLVLISLLVGIVAGMFALAEKFWSILPRRIRARRVFNRHFDAWVESGNASLPSHKDYRKVVGVALHHDLSDDQLGFSLLCALQHGDQSMHELIRRNSENSRAIGLAVSFLAGRGIRVGWRTEYALTRFPTERVRPILESLLGDERTSPPVREAAARIADSSVLGYLQGLANGTDSKSRSYAREVLAQIGSDVPNTTTHPVRSSDSSHSEEQEAQG